MKRIGSVVVILCLAATAALCGEVGFTAPPTAKKAGDKTVISFAVNAKTDVAVYVLDSKGRTVRHLVAGMLGEKAPAPLEPGLSQSIEWDGKDDDGKPASGGPFKVRVAAGLRPEFDRYLFHNPDAVPEVLDVVACPDGGLYVFYRDNVNNPNMGGVKVKAFDRDGRYRQTVLPFSGKIPFEKVSNMGTMRDDAGHLVPDIHSWASLRFHPSFFGAGRGRAIASSPAVDSRGSVHWMMRKGVLASLTADGGSPYESFLSQPVFSEDLGLTITAPICKTDATLAVGEGDRYLYVSSLFKGKAKNVKPVPCIYRLDLAKRGKAEVFAGDPKKAGKAGPLLSAPLGITCAGGVVYVADQGSDRVVGFREKDGGLAGEFKVSKPGMLGVDPAGGAVYVTTADGKLVKFESLASGKEVCRIELPPSRKLHHLALDASKKPLRIWLTIDAHRNNSVCCVEDAGGKLQLLEDVRIRRDESGLGGKQLSFDLRRGELLFQMKGVYCRMNEETGKSEEINFASKGRLKMGQLVTCADGSLISHGDNTGLWRWTRDGKALPWDGAPDNSSKHTGVTTTAMVLGPVDNMAVFGSELYVNPPSNWRLMKPKSGGEEDYVTSLNVHGMDGKVRRTVVWQCSLMAVPRVDSRGNVYLAENVKPRGRTSPEFFDGRRDKSHIKGYDSHNYMYGSIIKFPPEGGAVWFRKGVDTNEASGKKFTEGKMPEALLKKPEVPMSYPAKRYQELADGTVQGAEWVRFGYAPYSAHWMGGKPFCCCENASFDVDGFGRVFYPNLGQFRVEMVDTSNNWLGTFGRYGNLDDRAEAGDIPMAWPTYLTVSDKYVYVTDMISMRIVRVKLGCSAEATCVVP